MRDHYFQVMHAIQTAEWRGYNVQSDNGRFTATARNGSGMFYLTTDNDGLSYYWADIS